jgi:hypothetical protein
MNNVLTKKKNVISILLVAAAISLSAYAVQARRSASSPTGLAQGWEYCAIVDTAFSRTGNTIFGKARVVYYTTSGLREEFTTMQADVGNVYAADHPDIMVGRALSATVAKLGDQGWEMIGHMPVIGFFRTNTDQPAAIYFKRALMK